MDTNGKILCHLFSFDLLNHRGTMVIALAQRAIQEGFDSLSIEQKRMIQPYLSVKCCGYDDVDGHVECSTVLEGDDLLRACEVSGGSWLPQCRHCRAARNYIAYSAAMHDEWGE